MTSISTGFGGVWAVKAKGQDDRWTLRVTREDGVTVADHCYYDTDDMRYVLVGSALDYSTLMDAMYAALRDANAGATVVAQ